MASFSFWAFIISLSEEHLVTSEITLDSHPIPNHLHTRSGFKVMFFLSSSFQDAIGAGQSISSFLVSKTPYERDAFSHRPSKTGVSLSKPSA